MTSFNTSDRGIAGLKIYKDLQNASANVVPANDSTTVMFSFVAARQGRISVSWEIVGASVGDTRLMAGINRPFVFVRPSGSTDNLIKVEASLTFDDIPALRPITFFQLLGKSALLFLSLSISYVS